MVPARRSDHDGDGELVLGREGEVAFVVGGDAHDGAGAVGEQDVVGDPDRDELVGERVADVGAGEDAGFVDLGGLTLDFRLAAGLRDISSDGVAVLSRRELVDERVLGGEDEIADAKHGVGSRGEDADAIDLAGRLVEREGDFSALGAADPVALHQLDRLGPVDRGEVEQLIGVVGDAEEPLLEISGLDDGFAALAAADAGVVAVDLLIGEHGHAGGAPVGGGASAIGEAVVVELQEPPLGPAVVLRVGGRELAVPVEARAHVLKLAAHPLDVVVGPLLGVCVVLDRGVFGGQAERVEGDGEHHVEALHALPTRGNVARSHGVPVADMEVAARVGQHGEQEVGRALVVVGRAVEPIGVPAGAPARLDFGGVVVGDALSGRRDPLCGLGHGVIPRGVLVVWRNRDSGLSIRGYPAATPRAGRDRGGAARRD